MAEKTSSALRDRVRPFTVAVFRTSFPEFQTMCISSSAGWCLRTSTAAARPNNRWAPNRNRTEMPDQRRSREISPTCSSPTIKHRRSRPCACRVEAMTVHLPKWPIWSGFGPFRRLDEVDGGGRQGVERVYTVAVRPPLDKATAPSVRDRGDRGGGLPAGPALGCCGAAAEERRRFLHRLRSALVVGHRRRRRALRRGSLAARISLPQSRRQACENERNTSPSSALRRRSETLAERRCWKAPSPPIGGVPVPRVRGRERAACGPSLRFLLSGARARGSPQPRHGLNPLCHCHVAAW